MWFQLGISNYLPLTKAGLDILKVIGTFPYQEVYFKLLLQTTLAEITWKSPLNSFNFKNVLIIPVGIATPYTKKDGTSTQVTLTSRRSTNPTWPTLFTSGFSRRNTIQYFRVCLQSKTRVVSFRLTHSYVTIIDMFRKRLVNYLFVSITLLEEQLHLLPFIRNFHSW